MTKIIPMDEMVTIGQAAEILGVSQPTLRRWDKTGKFKARRHPINGYRIYSYTRLVSWAKEMALPNMHKVWPTKRQWEEKEKGERDARK